MHIINALKKTSVNKPILFTTPGHGQTISGKMKNLLGLKVFKHDFSEIEGLDNLQNPQGAILESQKWASTVYNSGQTYYLINGSSSGILALMLATAKENDKILIARNAHKSVVNALVLSGAHPIWMQTDFIKDWEISAPVNPEKIEQDLIKNKDIKAVWITSPTYEGVVSDVKAISDLCKKHNALLIVDEAHGALWNFHPDLPISTIQLGADACVQSLHKTASCLTQGAIMHLSKESKINPDKLQACLNTINTTSPSYILLASIEGTIEYLNSSTARKTINLLLENIDKFKEKLITNTNYKILNSSANIFLDKTKLNIGLSGINGFELCDRLENKYNIEVELCKQNTIMALTGIDTTYKKLNKLANALIISENRLKKDSTNLNLTKLNILPQVKLSPREAFFKPTELIDLNQSIGKICGETIVPYPPGIPILVIGEIIQQEHLEFLKEYNQIKIIL